MCTIQYIQQYVLYSTQKSLIFCSCKIKNSYHGYHSHETDADKRSQEVKSWEICGTHGSFYNHVFAIRLINNCVLN